MPKLKELPINAGCNWEISDLNPKNGKTPYASLDAPRLSRLASAIEGNLLYYDWVFIDAVYSLDLPDEIGLIYKQPFRHRLSGNVKDSPFTRNPSHMIRFGEFGERGQIEPPLRNQIDRYLIGTNLCLASPPMVEFGKISYTVPRKLLGLKIGEREAVFCQPGIARLSLSLETYQEALEALEDHLRFDASEQTKTEIDNFRSNYTNNPTPLFLNPHRLNDQACLPIDAFNSSSF